MKKSNNIKEKNMEIGKHDCLKKYMKNKYDEKILSQVLKIVQNKVKTSKNFNKIQK